MIWGLVAMVIAGILGLILIAISPEGDSVSLDVAPISSELTEEKEWAEFHELARIEYEDEFTALFNSYEIKRAKNGAMMIRRPGDKSFRFAKKG